MASLCRSLQFLFSFSLSFLPSLPPLSFFSPSPSHPLLLLGMESLHPIYIHVLVKQNTHSNWVTQREFINGLFTKAWERENVGKLNVDSPPGLITGGQLAPLAEEARAESRDQNLEEWCSGASWAGSESFLGILTYQGIRREGTWGINTPCFSSIPMISCWCFLLATPTWSWRVRGHSCSPSSQVSLVGGWRRVVRRHERQVEDIHLATLPHSVFFPHYNAIWYMLAYPGTIDAYIFIQLSKHFSKYLLCC